MDQIIKSLKIGDCIKINDWKEIFSVCGVSENFVLANHFATGQYTIIPKTPADHSYNGIPEGSYVCAPDHLIFGYFDGYHFDDSEWVNKYLFELENGEIEISMRRREKINTLRLCPNLAVLK